MCYFHGACCTSRRPDALSVHARTNGLSPRSTFDDSRGCSDRAFLTRLSRETNSKNSTSAKGSEKKELRREHVVRALVLHFLSDLFDFLHNKIDLQVIKNAQGSSCKTLENLACGACFAEALKLTLRMAQETTV